MYQMMPQHNGMQQELRSIHNRFRTYVKFLNTTPCKVSVLWVDYKGKLVEYGILGPQQYLEVDTYVTHPWVFIDLETCEWCLANHNYVFFPERIDIQQLINLLRSQQQQQQQQKRYLRVERTLVRITEPIKSLRTLCMKVIRRRLRDGKDAYSLELPRILQIELCCAKSLKPNSPKDLRDLEYHKAFVRLLKIIKNH